MHSRGPGQRPRGLGRPLQSAHKMAKGEAAGSHRQSGQAGGWPLQGWHPIPPLRTTNTNTHRLIASIHVQACQHSVAAQRQPHRLLQLRCQGHTCSEERAQQPGMAAAGGNGSNTRQRQGSSTSTYTLCRLAGAQGRARLPWHSQSGTLPAQLLRAARAAAGKRPLRARQGVWRLSDNPI